MGDGQFAMVSEWMENGNINEFTKARKDANRFELVWSFPHRRPLLLLTTLSDSSKMLPGD
jgi:hypothetical protein